MDPVTLTFQNPLTEQNFKEIQDGLEACRIAKQQIAMAKKAGIDVATQEKATLETEEKLQRIKTTYFPGR